LRGKLLDQLLELRKLGFDLREMGVSGQRLPLWLAKFALLGVTSLFKNDDDKYYSSRAHVKTKQKQK